MKQIASFSFLCALMLACQPKWIVFEANGESIAVITTDSSDASVDRLISPYRTKLSAEMSAVIGTASTFFDHNRTVTESTLGNWAADIVFEAGYEYLCAKNEYILKNNCFALLNKGGLRTSLSKGIITKGNVFEVMPFDNEIVIVQLDGKKLNDILKYLLEINGQPISNALLQISGKDGKAYIGGELFSDHEALYIITTDYLAKGGDNMYFFDTPIAYIQTGILMRDAMLKQIENVDTIYPSGVVNRIKFGE